MMNRYIIVILLVLGTANYSFGKNISDVRNGIELFMIKTRDWPAVRCRTGKYEGRNYVYCHPSTDDSFGGLFMVESDPTPALWPINGKAKQYLGSNKPTLLDGTAIEIRQWSGDTIDIPAVINAIK